MRHSRIEVMVAQLVERVEGLDRLTDEKFVRHGTALRDQAEKVALAHSATEVAIDKAEAATQRALEATAADVKQRFASVNEFRQTLSDQANTFIPRAEAEQRIAAVIQRLEAVRDEVTALRAETRGGAHARATLYTVGGLVIAALSVATLVISILVA